MSSPILKFKNSIDFSVISEQELLCLLEGGDRNAFAEIFKRYHDTLLNFAYNKLRNHEEANDVVQDVFIKLWTVRKEAHIQNLPAYLYTMLRNRIFSLMEHQTIVSNYQESFKNFNETQYTPTDYRVREKEFSEMIQKEIAALSPRTREIFELSRKSHLSNKQIALQLNLSEHTISDQIKKALRQLRLKMGIFFLALVAFLHF